MVPYSYNMVDMGGIDLAEANGTVVEGIYSAIEEAINMCGDVILYNWKFAGINIAPSAYSIIEMSGSILINGVIQVTELDQVTIIGLPLPVQPLLVESNGVYTAELPLYGYNPVDVRVPPPNIVQLRIEENGTYNAPEGVDGFSPVIANVAGGFPVLDGKRFCFKRSSGQYYGGFGAVSQWPTSGTVQSGDNIPPITQYTIYSVQDIISIVEGGSLAYSEFLSYVDSDLINDFGLVELARVATTQETEISLSDSIENYSAILLQGVYNSGGVTSSYDSTLFYFQPQLNVEYKTGMKDRWSSGTTGVTFTSATTAVLSGQQRVVIYGMPSQ